MSRKWWNGLPEFGTYGWPGRSGKADPNCRYLTICGVQLFFSYSQLVAFCVIGKRLVVCQNYWSKTTGKHLNWIDDKRHGDRVDWSTFQRLWNELVYPVLGDGAMITYTDTVDAEPVRAEREPERPVRRTIRARATET